MIYTRLLTGSHQRRLFLQARSHSRALEVSAQTHLWGNTVQPIVCDSFITIQFPSVFSHYPLWGHVLTSCYMQVVTISITLLTPGSQKFQMDILSPKVICCIFRFATTSEDYKALLGMKGGFLLLLQEQGVPLRALRGLWPWSGGSCVNRGQHQATSLAQAHSLILPKGSRGNLPS